MRKQVVKNKISESQVEECLVSNLTFLKNILNLKLDIKLIGRQLKLKGGDKRLDLLILHGKEIYLIELKITKFSQEYVNQVSEYKEELINLQQKGELINGEIISCLLVINASEENIKYAINQQVNVIIYEPLEVLKSYYEYLSISASFLKVKPNDYGVFNIGLIHRTLIQLSEGLSKQEDIAKVTNLSKNSIHNHLKIGKELGLVREKNNLLFLTDLGDKYIDFINEGLLLDQLTQNQKETLKSFIAKDPFYSSTVFGIYCLIESVFLLSRNEYPIQLSDLRQMFQKIGGKSYDWQSQRSINTATYTFLNFAIDLDLLGKIGKSIVITPSGFKFILMLQLHKSIDMIETIDKWS